ncbi:hypothetical protein NQ315_013632 [Exocentrus adspersus]|uniref:Uncharacterized protein n=1 Tax=Exocentrus adspersus TaxID=1586481 RepID=A0AAV8W3K9_9CUCU|nr:hypothetical protein NQ315_013632 [Exocentrus adspersus]
MPLGDFNGQNFNATFVPPGIPINLLHPDPKMYQNYVDYGPSSHFEPRSKSREDESQTSGDETATNYVKDITTCDNSSTAKEHQVEKATDKPQVQNVKSKIIDIATIVYKLEEAAKEQNGKGTHKTRNKGVEIHNSPRRKFPDNASNRTNQRYKNIPNHKRNHYNSAQNSPQRNIHSFRERSSTPYREPQKESKPENDYLPERQFNEGPKIPVIYNSGASSIESKGMVQVQVSPKRNQENKKNWKYQSTQNSKWQHNNPVRGYKSTYYNDKQRTNNEYKNEPLRNYSSTLKSKTPVYTNEPRHEHHNNSEQLKAAYDANAAKTEEALKTSIPQSKQSNQWISVSSRKKRKNKSADEVEVSLDVDEQDHSELDLLEKYDVNELTDVVVPTSQEEEEIIKVETTEEIVVGDIISNVTQNEESLVTNIENIALNVTIRSVDGVEKELIAKNPTETETINTVPEIASNQDNTGVEDNILSETITDTSRKCVEDDNIKTKVNKKSKKGAQKPQTKRVIITDVDLSMQCEELKTPLKKIVTKLNEKPSEIVKEEIATEAEEKIDEKAEPPKRDVEEEKKKNKKKKKKPSKTTITNSLSSSSATINNIDDSYDFLLDSALSPQSIEKTNVEISQEFDKIIQKGMYSSLEGKIKSMNINDSDGFFKSVFSNISIPTPNKNGFNKQPDLSRILQDSRSLFRSSSVSQESSSQNKETIKILPNFESPVQDGFFLKKPDVTDYLYRDKL